MTHEELHALLPTYAAGTLSPQEAQAVRRHLASGCPQCLGDLFRRPVGMPRAPVERTPARARPGVGWLVGLGTVAVLLGFATTWLVASWRTGADTTGALLGTLRAQLERGQEERSRLAGRADALERELADVRAEEQSRAAEAASADAAREQASRDLAAAQERIATLARGVQRRDGEIDRLLSGVDDVHALRELLTSPGVRLIPLVGDGGARGHVLWHPDRAVLVVALFDLPPLPEGAVYRVRTRGDGARGVDGPAVRPGADGDTVVTMRLRQPPGPALEVTVDREPPGERVLGGRAAAAAS